MLILVEYTEFSIIFKDVSTPRHGRLPDFSRCRTSKSGSFEVFDDNALRYRSLSYVDNFFEIGVCQIRSAVALTCLV